MATRPVIVLLTLVATLMFALLARVYKQGTRTNYVQSGKRWSPHRVAVDDAAPKRDLKQENELLAERVRKLELELLKKQEGAMAQAATAAAAPSTAVAAQPKQANTSDYRLTPSRIRDRCDANNIILVTFVNAKRVEYPRPRSLWCSSVTMCHIRSLCSVACLAAMPLAPVTARSGPSVESSRPLPAQLCLHMGCARAATQAAQLPHRRDGRYSSTHLVGRGQRSKPGGPG